jgi:hypothetical protein
VSALTEQLCGRRSNRRFDLSVGPPRLDRDVAQRAGCFGNIAR